jgi:2-polyprenyl-6-methoxyphenol hydroxylase-like FAD-dependent oxidoreductase
VIPGPNGRRYTTQDEEKVVQKYKADKICDGVSFGDLYKHKIRSRLISLEEGVFNQWSFGRIVLIGDAAHKV